MASADQRQSWLDRIEDCEQALKRWDSYLAPGLFRKLRRMVHFPAWYASAMLGRAFRRDIELRLPWGRTLVSPSGDIGAEVMRHCGARQLVDVRTVKFLLKHLKADEVFYDIGAHIGFYTTLAQELCCEGEVHAFEPSPAFSYLMRNAGGRPRSFLNNFAVSDKPATIRLYVNKKSSCHSTIRAEVANRWSGMKLDERFSYVQVPATTIDLYAQKHQPPTVMKIDVEGAEELVLRGAAEVVRKNAPIIVMEICAGELGRKVHGPAVRFLHECGYRPHRITAAGEIELLAYLDEIWKGARNEYCDYDNFVFFQ